MSAQLEGRYRAALRWYPESWRRKNEDAMVGTLLDVAEERGESSPSKGDLRHLRARGIQARLGWAGRILTSTVRDRLSLIAVGSGVAISLWGVIFSIVDRAQLHGVLLPKAFEAGRDAAYTATTFGPFASLDVILCAAWLAAFVAALAGRPILTRALLFATIPAAIAAGPLSAALGMPDHPSTSFLVLLGLLAVLGSLGTPRPTARWRQSVGLSGVIATLVLSLTLWQSHIALFVYPGMDYFHGPIGVAFPLDGWVCLAAPALAIVCIGLAKWSWAAVIAISALPWLAAYVQANAFSPSPGDVLLWIGVAVVLAAIAAGISLRTRHLRIRITVSRD
jgi:hypothetical protein